MYTEKIDMINKIREFSEVRDIEMTFDQMEKFASKVLYELDASRLLSLEDFNELLEHNETIDSIINSEIVFDDEIVEITDIGEHDCIDIDVSGNKLFYANDILTHNSAVNSTEADNAAISDSLGSAMVADFILFLLQNEEMKANQEICFKVTKNRFNGRTDTFLMNIDYEKMRFSDMLVQGALDDVPFNSNTGKIDDFGIVTSEKQTKAETFAEQEVKDIEKESWKAIKEHDKREKFDSTDDILRELGL